MGLNEECRWCVGHRSFKEIYSGGHFPKGTNLVTLYICGAPPTFGA